MHIHCLGLNHTTADIELREKLAFTENSVRAALARLGCGNGVQPDAVSEMVILSTCNRVEIYAIAPRAAFEALEDFLADVRDVPRVAFTSHMYHLLDHEAIAHLFRVAAGLDSLVLGEPQILGQVMQAFELARGQNATGPVLSRLFQAALRAGKRARTETAISHNPASISSVAIRLAESEVHDLPNARVLVVGAGEMAELAVEALRKRGVAEVQVVNRTLARARKLAGRWGGGASTFENLPEVIKWADILITSTGAPHTIISKELVAGIMSQRVERALAIIDIAVPRDVDPSVNEIPTVSLYDIDTLQEHLEYSLARREKEVPQVEAILEEVQAEFEDYLAMLDVIPLIAEMHQRAESIRRNELDKTLRRLPDLDEGQREHLNLLTQALVKKLLHAPITQLRSAAGGPQAVEYATAARKLFDLEAQHKHHFTPQNSGNGRGVSPTQAMD
jgi:glutamyl-tRNA reductase